MTPHPRLSKAGIELVKRFEGLRHKAARLENGGWTIGYGHTASAREGAEVDAEQAELLLVYDLDRVARTIDPLIFSPLNDNQFNALTAFAFNVGVENFHGSAVVKRINEGAYLQAASAIELWRRSDFQGDSLVVDGLVRRRAAEKILFLTPPDGFRPIPTPVVRPLWDDGAARPDPAPALARAADLRVPLDGEHAVAERSNDVEEAARNVAVRLQQLFPEAEDAETSEPAPPPMHAPQAASEPEPPPLPEPDPTAAEPEPPPAPQPVTPEPVASAFNWPIEPPVAQHIPAAAVPHQLFAPAPNRQAGTDELEVSGFGQRQRRQAPSTPPAEASYRVLVIGAVGALMFIGALVAMIYGKATLVNLGIGLIGVLCMAPAGLHLLMGLFGEQPTDRR